MAEFFLGEKEMVAHNLPFDAAMLLFELRRCQAEIRFPWPMIHTDTIQLAMPHYKGKFMKLTDLHDELVGPYEQKHRALDDCYCLKRVHEALLAKN